MFEKINGLSLPATILLGCVILGVFYYLTEASKQSSIENQNKAKIEAEERRLGEDKLNRAVCADQAETSASAQYKETCTYDCKEGYYYTANYENYYKSCLQARGLEP